MNGAQLVPDDHVIVLFGATGDLARRRLLPGLFRLAEAGLMPERYRIVGTSRESMDADGFRRFARAALDEFGGPAPNGSWDAFARTLSYSDADEEAPALAAAVERAELGVGGTPRRLHYLSVPPAASAGIVATLRHSGLTARSRVIMEKPFGTDLGSAQALNGAVHAVFDESQVFRIDHFLGKETVQNILACRFGNGVFESIWNRDHIERVQIDVPETLSIGTRAGFYEETGAFRDMIVTHLFQVLGFVAMEPPTSFSPKALVDETVKVFETLVPVDPAAVVRGQYAGYRDEPGVAPDSQTETFVAMRVEIDNWRWAGVPFYLRTGKRMAESRRLLTITFRRPPRRLFDIEDGFVSNELVFDLSDRGGIAARFLAKVPGPTMELAPARFRFDYEDSFGVAHELEAYERLIHDALVGDHTLFTRADGIERLWEVSAPVLQAPPPLREYAPGSWGPPGTDELIAPGRWNLPELRPARSSPAAGARARRARRSRAS
jgi:glucose-6-phosphate 1-dehydrogenase